MMLTRSASPFGARPLPAVLGFELRLAPGEAFARPGMPGLRSFHCRQTLSNVAPKIAPKLLRVSEGQVISDLAL